MRLARVPIEEEARIVLEILGVTEKAEASVRAAAVFTTVRGGRPRGVRRPSSRRSLRRIAPPP